MSQPSSPIPQPPPSASNSPSRPRLRLPRPLFLIVFFGIFVPYGLLQIPREIGRWHLASAYQSRANGDAEDAYRQLEAADYWFPNNPTLLLQRAEWKMDDGDRDAALADCEAMLKAGGETYVWLAVHASFLQHAGKFADAVTDWKKIDENSHRSGIPNRAAALNGLAYAQALAKTELDSALNSVNEALDLSRDNPNILDTRGFIHFQRDEYEEALADLDIAVAGVDKEVELIDKIADHRSSPPLFTKAINMRPKRLSDVMPADTSNVDAARHATGLAAAVVHYHRSLVLDALDRQQDAKKDREIAAQFIGHEPDETLF